MNDSTSENNESLINTIDATTQILTKVERFKSNQENAAYVQLLNQLLTEKMSQYSDIFDFMIWLNETNKNNPKKVTHPAILKAVLEDLKSLKNELLKEPPFDTEKIDKLRERFQNYATQLIQEQETKASQNWITFFDDTLQLEPPNLYTPFATDPKHKKNCVELEKIYILLQEARSMNYLEDQNERKEFLQNLEKYRNTIKKLPRIDNEEIRDFLLAASTVEGVSLRKFTESVKDFLKENSLYEQYRISINE